MNWNRSLGMRDAVRLIIVIGTLLLAIGASTAGTIKTLHSFTGGEGGNGPAAGLIFDQEGNLYGTAGGGAYNGGVVFELTPNANGSWAERVLYNFCSLEYYRDGGGPAAGVIFDSAGNLYGTTTAGGTGFNSSGAVFKLTPNAHGNWSETALYSFCSRTNCVDGRQPTAGLVFDAKGNLYGTTEVGGKGAACYTAAARSSN